MKLNCWQVKACQRQPGGLKVSELGVCPAAEAKTLDGSNGGKNGGRICWAVSGTFCGGIVQGTFAGKRASCLTCEFYQQVNQAEGLAFRLMPPGQSYQRAEKKPSLPKV